MGERDDDRTDEELLVAAVDERAAFAAFYRRHVDAVAGFFMNRTRDAENAADLTAETFAAAMAGRRRYDPSKGPAAAWLYGIARHKLARAHERGQIEDRARKRLGMARLALDDEALERIEALGDGPATVLLGSLPPDQHDAVRLRIIEEQDYREIARAVECSESLVRKRVSRGIETLRARLEESAP